MKRPVKNEIRTYRLRRGFSQRDVAKILGYRNQSPISHWENGSKVPNLENFLKLSAALKVPPELLYRDLLRKVREEVFRRKREFGIWERYG